MTTDKRTTLDSAVATLESGMTLGIGGWGSRRKPMSLVRALLRTDIKDLTVVSYGGPDVGLLCAAGRVKNLFTDLYHLIQLPSSHTFVAHAKTQQWRSAWNTTKECCSGRCMRVHCVSPFADTRRFGQWRCRCQSIAENGGVSLRRC